MIIYFCIYGLFLVVNSFNYVYQAGEKRARISFCFFAFLAITTMFALRHQSMGVDLNYLGPYGYLANFDKMSNIQWNEIFHVNIMNYERGYIILSKIVNSICNNRQFFMAICSIFSILPIAILISKESLSPAISFIVYMGLPVFLINYSGLRQALAIGICAISMIFIKEKKLIKFIITVFLATTFHYSSFLFFFAYPLYHIKLKDTVRYISVILIPFFYIFRVSIFNILSKILKENAVATENDSGVLLIVFALVYIFCIIYTDGSDEQNGLMNLFLIACICQTFGNIYQTAMRVGYYFMISLILLIPSVLMRMKLESNKAVFTIIVIIAFVAFGLYSIFSSTWAMAYPYYFYWQTI